MKKLLSILATLVVAPLTFVAAAQPAVATARIVSAADLFLASLDGGQRRKVLYAFDDNEQTMHVHMMYLAPLILAVPAGVAAQPGVATAGIVSAANLFLASLDGGQRQKVLYAFDDNELTMHVQTMYHDPATTTA